MRVKFLITMCFMIVFSYVHAQSENTNTLDNQILIIYNEYTPVLKDANRIQFLPTVVDTAKIVPKFEYNVFPARYKTNFQPTPINVAKVKGENLKPLDNGMIKLGVGNYWTPYIEAFYNNRRNKYYSAGAHVKHHSSHGKTKNSVGDKVYNGYAKNIIEGFGRRFFAASTLSGGVGFSSDIVNFYGYDPDSYIGMTPDKSRKAINDVNYMRIHTNMGFASNNISKYDFNYDANLKYQYFFTSDKNSQHKIDLNIDANKMFANNRFGLDGGLEFNKNNFDVAYVVYEENTSYNETFLKLNPYYKLYSNNWQIILGVNTTGIFSEEKTKYHFHPNLHIQHNVGNVLIPYASFKGNIVNNNLEYLSTINPFMSPMESYFTNAPAYYQNTDYAQIIDIGLKCNVTKNVYFHINANYSKINNMAFFVTYKNRYSYDKFIIEYSNVERFSGYGEIVLRNIYKLDFTLNGHYYYYSYIQSSEKPWHLPKFDLSFKANYKHNEKLNFGMDIFVMSKRYAKTVANANTTIAEVELKPIFDIGLCGNYKLSHNFECFLELNNLTGQRQYIWDSYHSQRFNFLLGLKYLF